MSLRDVLLVGPGQGHTLQHIDSTGDGKQPSTAQMIN